MNEQINFIWPTQIDKCYLLNWSHGGTFSNSKFNTSKKHFRVITIYIIKVPNVSIHIKYFDYLYYLFGLKIILTLVPYYSSNKCTNSNDIAIVIFYLWFWTESQHSTALLSIIFYSSVFVVKTNKLPVLSTVCLNLNPRHFICVFVPRSTNPSSHKNIF